MPYTFPRRDCLLDTFVSVSGVIPPGSGGSTAGIKSAREDIDVYMNLSKPNPGASRCVTAAAVLDLCLHVSYLFNGKSAVIARVGWPG